MAWNDDLICRKSIDRLSFGPFQLVSNAQADMGQDLSQVHLAPFSQSVVLIFLNHLLLVLVDLVVFFFSSSSPPSSFAFVCSHQGRPRSLQKSV